MRRFFTISFIILALAVSAAGSAPAAHADQCGSGIDSCDTGYYCDTTTTPAACKVNDPKVEGSPAHTAEKIALDKNRTENASWGFGWIMETIMSLFAWLVGVAALTLNYAMYYTVVNMGGYVTHLSAIGTVWKILRDIGNILLIFGFLAIGISYIIDSEWYGGGKKLLPKLLIVAVFANFSLFAAEAMIDVGNLFATQIYKQINEGKIPNPSDASADTGFEYVIQNKGVAGVLMNRLGLPSIYGGSKEISTKGLPVFAGNSPWYMSFMSIIVFIVVAFVMFALALILVSRFIVLILLIMVSPVGVAGLAVPGLQSWAKKWWDTLFQQTITAPILLLLLYIALSVIVDPGFLGFDTNARPAWNGIETGHFIGFAGILLSYLIAVGLLLAVVYFAKTLSAVGAGWATKMGGRLSFGAVSLGARATFGSAGNLLASKRMQAWSRTGKGKALRPLILAGKGLRSTTYDLRNAPGAVAGLGAFGIDAGKGATLTAKQAHDAQYGKKAVDAWFQQSTEEREQAGREIDFKKAQKAIATADAALAAGTITQAQYDTNVAGHEKTITGALSKMSTKELEALGGIKKGTDALVNNLSPQQFEALMKSDKLNDVEKNKIKEARYHTVLNAIGSGNPLTIKKAIGGLSKGELESMPTTMLTHPLVLDALSDKQRDTITDSKERTTAEKASVRNASPTGKVEEIFNGAGRGAVGASAVAADPSFARLTVPQIAKLDKDILLQSAVAEKLTTATLIELQDQKKLTPAEMITIGNQIRASNTANAKTKDYVTNGPGAALWS